MNTVQSYAAMLCEFCVCVCVCVCVCEGISQKGIGNLSFSTVYLYVHTQLACTSACVHTVTSCIQWNLP